MSHLSPDEIEKIKEEQSLRTRETVKTGIRMYFSFLRKVLKYTCGCIAIVILLVAVVSLIISGIIAINQNMQTKKYTATSSAMSTKNAKIMPTSTITITSTATIEQIVPPMTIVPKRTLTIAPESSSTNAPEPTLTRKAPEITLPLPYPTITPGVPMSYKLVSDQEFPICIARRFNLDLSEFFALNNLNMNSRPPVGTELLIPQTGRLWNSTYGSRSLKSHPASYTVVANDTIYGIACRYGDVFPEEIMMANGLKSTDLTPGQKLYIP